MQVHGWRGPRCPHWARARSRGRGRLPARATRAAPLESSPAAGRPVCLALGRSSPRPLCHPHLAYSERQRLRWAQGSQGRWGLWVVSIGVPLAQVLFPCNMIAPPHPRCSEGKWANVAAPASPGCGAQVCGPGGQAPAWLQDSRQRPPARTRALALGQESHPQLPRSEAPRVSAGSPQILAWGRSHPTSRCLVPVLVLAPLHL